jgi:integrase
MSDKFGFDVDEFAEIAPLTTTIIRFESGERFVLTVNALGFPVEWPVVYCSVALRNRGVALSTMRKSMDAVCQLHNWAIDRGISLEERIEALEFFTMAEIAALRAELRVNLRNSVANRQRFQKSRKTVVGAGHWRNRLIAVAEYLIWRSNDVILKMSVREERRMHARLVLDEFAGLLVGDIRIFRNSLNEGMDEEAQKALLLAITPGHPTNPFRPRNQYRNQALWLTYFDGGVRRSEALVAKCRDLRLGGDDPKLAIHRRADDPEDVRIQEPRTKTLAHAVSLSSRLQTSLDEYIRNHRPTYPGARRSPYLFLSQKGLPLSIGAVDRMYLELREKVPGLPEHFSPHVLRRTWNDRFGEAADQAGFSADAERQTRNQAQGWTRTSEQGAGYERRRNRKRAADILVRMQDAVSQESGE